MSDDFTVTGNVIDLHQRRLFGATVEVRDGRIAAIIETGQTHETYLLPGFVDAHIHIESSMLVPSEFARMAVLHGTVATVSDPHEIANVLGIEGVRFMIENGRTVPFKFNFGAPSCVPATSFETAGATLDPQDIEELLSQPEVCYLAEMMNFPGVLHADAMVLAKLSIAKRLNKPIDGHAPGLRREDAKKYFAAGISTDHECFTLEEALDKLSLPNVHILIREGSAARNFEALHPLLSTHPDHVMLCSDDKHPDSLETAHINELVARAKRKGHDLFNILRAASVTPVQHYKLDVGLLRIGDSADFIEIPDLRDFRPMRTWIDGRLVADRGKSLIDAPRATTPNHFNASPKRPQDFRVGWALPTSDGGHCPPYKSVNVIEAFDGQLITRKVVMRAAIENGSAVADPSRDLLKIAVVNRYSDAPPAVGFIHNIGIKRGAIASSVAHDSHNIVAVGADDESICRAVNLLIESRGGLALVDGEECEVLPLPVAGLMSNDDGHTVASAYSKISAKARALGSPLAAPYMTLSFMALLVIPSLKMSDKGLFDGENFEFANVFI